MKKGQSEKAQIDLKPYKMAEREGFEPSVELLPYTRLAGERLQPTRPSLRFQVVVL